MFSFKKNNKTKKETHIKIYSESIRVPLALEKIVRK